MLQPKWLPSGVQVCRSLENNCYCKGSFMGTEWPHKSSGFHGFWWSDFPFRCETVVHVLVLLQYRIMNPKPFQLHNTKD
jgi:hypothetical protein